MSLATAKATHAGALRASLLTRGRSAARFLMSASMMLPSNMRRCRMRLVSKAAVSARVYRTPFPEQRQRFQRRVGGPEPSREAAASRLRSSCQPEWAPERRPRAARSRCARPPSFPISPVPAPISGPLDTLLVAVTAARQTRNSCSSLRALSRARCRRAEPPPSLLLAISCPACWRSAGRLAAADGGPSRVLQVSLLLGLSRRSANDRQ